LISAIDDHGSFVICPSVRYLITKAIFPDERAPASTMTKDDIQLLFEYDRWANRASITSTTCESTPG
jgi:hypothetical protein